MPVEGRHRTLRGFDSDRGTSFGAPAIIVHPASGRLSAGPARPGARRAPAARLEEIVGLAAAIRLDIREALVLPMRAQSPSLLLGRGQVERIAGLVAAHGAEVVVIDSRITPIQQKNLETALAAKVIDRTSLILEIFGARAATAEGRLQVELAHLEYQAGRLVRSWTHLERQRGGFGFLGGPGETQIEADRRQLRDRIARIRRELEEVRRTRGLHRARRRKAPVPVIALVGYTNAGKSTLFNRLTGARVLAADLLFATLDPTMRRLELPGAGTAILSDTVGFVSDLPTELVAAFRATLEEVTQADLIVHVRDIAHPDSEAQAADVHAILSSLGLDDGRVPVLEVLNKADLLEHAERAALAGRPGQLLISAQGGEG
ncbi:GTPase HflX, partial [Thermaurantiacus sp.]